MHQRIRGRSSVLLVSSAAVLFALAIPGCSGGSTDSSAVMEKGVVAAAPIEKTPKNVRKKPEPAPVRRTKMGPG